MKTIGLIVCLACFPTMTAAQEAVIKNLSEAGFEKIIKEDLKKDFTKKDDPSGTIYDIKDTDYFAQFSSRGKFVMFYAVVDGTKLSLEKINAWNRDAVFSRAYLLNNKVHFEVALSFAAGVTRDGVKDCYERMDKEWKDFGEKVLKGN